MDPDAALAEIREILSRRDMHEGLDAERLADLIDGLDTWISRGGFLPRNWRGTK